VRKHSSFIIMCICLCWCFIAGLSLADDPKISITYGDNAQFEIVSPQGIRILIDVYEPSILSKPASADDILLTTHNHPDHVSPIFIGSFPGQHLWNKPGEIKKGDVLIKGITASHSDTDVDPFTPEDGSDHIFIIQAAGLKIVHFGDIGQEKLTPEQLKDLSRVDIAMTQFSNSYSNMNIENKKGFNLMAQVHPKLIIPTHYDEATAKYALELWEGSFAEQRTIGPSTQDLSEKTKIVLMGAFGESLGKKYKLPKTRF
jgi:L-ascorbate metabolism protein UlaG (beta-lactamase superfamily)